MHPVMDAFSLKVFFLVPLVKIVDDDDILPADLIEVADETTPDKTHCPGDNNHASIASDVA